MRSPTAFALAAPCALLVALTGCSSSSEVGSATPPSDTNAGESGDGAASDSAPVESAAPQDAGDSGDGSDACAPLGAPGECVMVSACAALGDHTSYAGYCPGPTGIECCIRTPSTADNPPIPAGWVLMQQAQVTAAMTTWAVMILHDPTMYPMFDTAVMAFGALTVLARVEWHPPDFQNGVVHRGVTLYEPAG